ncbi:MAG: LEA type 2 family protein [Labilithrix sp.]|nr:LEA type 2 family protein [Labilithrix sp.]
MRALLVSFLLVALGALFFGCSPPAPPTLTPKEAKVTTLDLAGIDLRVTMEVHNPNKIDLAVRAVTARVLLDGKHDLGTMTITQPVTLPAGARTLVEVPLSMKWKDATLFGVFAAAKRSVPYTIDGTATIGGERLNVTLPFTMKGVVTAEELTAATLKSLKGLPAIPGLAPLP